MTGDVSPDAASLKRAHLIITTPEKWDLVTRSWRSGGISANLASRTALLIMDEIHLLGEERGPVLEAMVTRARFVAEQTGRPLRFVGLSTALANPQDLGDWLGISRNGPGMYNFRPSVRPIPCEVHIQGYPDKNYCPRMASMNRPAFAAILEHSPDKPVLIFVASRRQTRLTAMDLISLAAATDTPKRFLRMPEDEAEVIAATVKDPSLRHALTFGVGMHHAGLVEGDRDVVEMLFARGALQVLVCTATLAWGVNFPAHLVIVKGTEFFDAKEGRYVDFPVTDVLQMVGRAGRPQFDTHAVAVILVHAPKKNFYKRFMYEPFPVESQLVKALHNILNAEVAGGSVRSISDAIDYLTWTYLFRRLVQNPSYYQLEDASPEAVQGWLMSLVSGTLVDLEAAGCVELSQDTDTVITTPLGCIASRCYLDYRTVDIARGGLAEAGNAGLDIVGACRLIADAEEFAELPVRHNEDKVNAELGALVRFRLAVDDDYASPHGKAFLLLQAHFGRTPLPMSDYVTDTRTVLDQASRVAGGMAEMAGEEGRLASTLQLLRVQQMMVQACWDDDDPLLQVGRALSLFSAFNPSSQLIAALYAGARDNSSYCI
jgi:activating signal cointegrator complex subunit 3